MFRLPRPTPASAPGRRMVSPRRRILLFGGGLVCLWGALQLAPMPSTPPPSAPTTTVVAPPSGASATGAEGPTRAVAARPPTSPSPARAATAGPVAGRPSAGREAGERRRSERGLLRPGNVLAFLLLAGGGVAAVVLHRRKRGIGPATASTPAMGVIGEISLGPGQAVRLVRVHDEVLVLGVATTGLTLLHRYPYVAPAAAPVAADGTEAPAAGAPASDGSVGHLFADVLRRYVPVPVHA